MVNGSCLLFVRCWLCFVRYSLFGVLCLWFVVVSWLVVNGSCVLFVVVGCWLWCIVYCPLFVVCVFWKTNKTSAVCLLFAVCCVSCVVVL